MSRRPESEGRRLWLRAHEEARGLGHGVVGSEHLLLACLAGVAPTVSALFDRLGLDPAALRARVLSAVRLEDPEDVPEGQLPITPHLRQALEQAAQEAEQLGAPRPDAVHLVLGLLRIGSSAAGHVLASAGVTAAQARLVLGGQDEADERSGHGKP